MIIDSSDGYNHARSGVKPQIDKIIEEKTKPMNKQPENCLPRYPFMPLGIKPIPEKTPSEVVEALQKVLQAKPSDVYIDSIAKEIGDQLKDLTIQVTASSCNPAKKNDDDIYIAEFTFNVTHTKPLAPNATFLIEYYLRRLAQNKFKMFIEGWKGEVEYKLHWTINQK